MSHDLQPTLDAEEASRLHVRKMAIVSDLAEVAILGERRPDHSTEASLIAAGYARLYTHPELDQDTVGSVGALAAMPEYTDPEKRDFGLAA